MNIEKFEIKPGQYIWVDVNIVIKGCDFVYHLSKGCIYEIYSYSESNGNKSFIPKDEFGLPTNDEMLITDVVKIIAASPELELEGVPDYVEWLADEYSKNKSSSSVFTEAHKRDFIKGYKTAEQEMFTEEDLIKAIALSMKYNDKTVIDIIKSEKR